MIVPLLVVLSFTQLGILFDTCSIHGHIWCRSEANLLGKTVVFLLELWVWSLCSNQGNGLAKISNFLVNFLSNLMNMLRMREMLSLKAVARVIEAAKNCFIGIRQKNEPGWYSESQYRDKIKERCKQWLWISTNLDQTSGTSNEKESSDLTKALCRQSEETVKPTQSGFCQYLQAEGYFEDEISVLVDW